MTWTEEEEAQVDNEIARLGVACQAPVDSVTLATYADILSDCKAADVIEACRRLARRVERFPSAAAVRNEAKDIAKERAEYTRPIVDPSPAAARSIIERTIAKMRERLRS